jgi:hypothetical protein
MEKPTNQDPAAWARYNAARPPISVKLYEVPPAIDALMLAITRAVMDLQNGGDVYRVARHLLTAQARFTAEVGL